MPFALRRLRIHELKSIHRLDHVFHDEGLTLFGRNGSGKTTLLEAISLLGHLGVMALAPLEASSQTGRATVRTGPSLLNAALGDAGGTPVVGDSERLRARFAELKVRLAPYAGELEPQNTSNGPESSLAVSSGENVVEAAFKEFSCPGDAACARSLVLFDVVRDGEPISLLVQLADRNTDLTVALSHEFSDRDTERALTLYYDANSVAARDFILSSLACRPVSLTRGGSLYAAPDRSAAGVVSYVNTDLNDFGRGNDLRESPKNITDDFAAVIARLGIDTRSILGPLNEILSRILSPDERRGWSVEELSVEAGKTRLVVTDHFGKPQLRNHLSAGENEVFFAFLVLLGLPTEGGIVILDEPAFHASPETAPAFFDELYRLCRSTGIQVFVGSHNAWCLPEEADHPTATLEIPRTPEAPHRLLDPLDSRQRFQALHRDAFERMERSVKGIEVATRDRARLLAHSVREQLSPVTEQLFWDRLGFFAGLAAATILSVHVALTGTLPVALLSAGCALVAAGALGWLLSNHLAALHRRRGALVKRTFFEHYAASEADSNERALFLRELDAASRWQLRAQLGAQRLPLVEFLPAWTGNFWPTVSFTLGHFAIAATIVWWYTGSWALGGQIALIEPIVNGFWHYANAHLWQSGTSEE